MHFTTTSTLEHLQADCLILPLFANDHLDATSQALDTATAGRLLAPLKRGDFTAQIGTTLLRSDIEGLCCERVLLVGAGQAEKFTMGTLQKLFNAAFNAIAELKVAHCTLVSEHLASPQLTIDTIARVAAEQMHRCVYRYTTCKSTAQTIPVLERLTLLVDHSATQAAQRGLELGSACGEGINYARELANLPGNFCTPGYLAEQAQLLAKDKTLTTTVLGEEQLQALGAGALLAVGQGSEQESRLIVMQYQGANDDSAPHVLVGKGITFDTGGISLKPGADMDEMRYDMGGAASVLGTMKALQLLKPTINVVAIIATAENMPDGKALKPGDIIKTLNGLTVEVLNTDAEGRLVLCDALAYAERFTPASVIDIATLTGACVIALGDHASALFSNDATLTQSLEDAAQTAWDRVWPMPLWEDYQPQLDSNFADLANIGGRKAGAITAACFLSRFATQYRWAHLDVAGTAWRGKQGATGRPVGLLTHYLLAQS